MKLTNPIRQWVRRIVREEIEADAREKAERIRRKNQMYLADEFARAWGNAVEGDSK